MAWGKDRRRGLADGSKNQLPGRRKAFDPHSQELGLHTDRGCLPLTTASKIPINTTHLLQLFEFVGYREVGLQDGSGR